MRWYLVSLALASAMVGCATNPVPLAENNPTTLNPFHRVGLNAARRWAEEAETNVHEASVSRSEATKFLADATALDRTAPAAITYARRLVALREAELEAARERFGLAQYHVQLAELLAARSEGRGGSRPEAEVAQAIDRAQGRLERVERRVTPLAAEVDRLRVACELQARASGIQLPFASR